LSLLWPSPSAFFLLVPLTYSPAPLVTRNSSIGHSAAHVRFRHRESSPKLAAQWLTPCKSVSRGSWHWPLRSPHGPWSTQPPCPTPMPCRSTVLVCVRGSSGRTSPYPGRNRQPCQDHVCSLRVSSRAAHLVVGIVKLGRSCAGRNVTPVPIQCRGGVLALANSHHRHARGSRPQRVRHRGRPLPTVLVCVGPSGRTSPYHVVGTVALVSSPCGVLSVVRPPWQITSCPAS